jgi:anti-anti-sigma regulatory factor
VSDERESTPRPAHPTTVSLPAKATLAAAPAIRDALLAAEGDVTVDASAVKVLTTPVLQLLIAASARARDGGRRFAIEGCSDAALACLAELGTDPARIATAADLGEAA